MKTVVALGFKGGTGKTTVSLHLGAGLALYHNKKVLLVDFDPQANLSQGLGYSPDTNDTMVEVLQRRKNTHDVIVKTEIKNLSLIKANTYLDEVESSPELGKDFFSLVRLKEELDKVKEDYDYCFIDVPPSLGWLCKSASYASNYIIINSVPEPYSILAMARLKEYIKTVPNGNPSQVLGQNKNSIQVLGIVLSRWDKRTILSREAIQALMGSFEEGVFETKIRMDMSINNAIISGEPIYTFDPNSRASEDFKNLTKEFLKRVKKVEGSSNEKESKLARSR